MKSKKVKLEDVASRIRDMVIRMAYNHQSSHVGSCLSCVEIMVYLYYYKMKKGDIFILSKGHAALTQYCILNDLGIIPAQKLWDYPKELGIHPELSKENMIFASTGSLGHGLGVGLGYAIANRDINVYVLMGDGEMDEGSVYEALGLKGQLGATNLIPIIDRNGFKGFGEIKMRTGLPDGHDFNEIDNRFSMVKEYPIIEFRTIKGKGLKRFENELGGHYWSINNDDLNEYKKDLF